MFVGLSWPHQYFRIWSRSAAMGGPSAVACSYRSPHEPSSPTTNCSNKQQTRISTSWSNQLPSVTHKKAKTHLQSFVKPAVAAVGERPASMQNLGGLTAGIPVNQRWNRQEQQNKRVGIRFGDCNSDISSDYTSDCKIRCWQLLLQEQEVTAVT